MSDLDRRIIRGSAWLAVGYGGTQVASLVVTAVLAHLLSPAEFGLVALASLALVVANALQESGLSAALIYDRGEVREAASTALVFMLTASVVLYGAVFALAPLLALAFGQPGLRDVARVLALVLVLRAVGSVTGALIERELLYARRAGGELAGAAAQAATSIALAVAGFGVWSLVAGQLAAQLVQSALFAALSPVRPSRRLVRWGTLRRLARYGRHITASNLILLVDGNLDNVTVGRLLGSGSLGIYNLAWRLANLPATGLGYIVGRAMFPAYASIREDREAFRAAYLDNLRRVALVCLPTGIVILLGAHTIVVGIFGERWEAAASPLRILAVFGLIRSFAGTTGAVFQASGRPDYVFKISAAHLVVLAGALAALTPTAGVDGAAAAMTIAAASSLVPSFVIVLRTLQLGLARLLRELRRPLACSLPLAPALLAVDFATRGLQPQVELVCLVVVALVVYGASVLTVGREELLTIRAAVRG